MVGGAQVEPPPAIELRLSRPMNTVIMNCGKLAKYQSKQGALRRFTQLPA